MRNQTYDEFEQEMQAVHDGTATALIRCYMCSDDEPLRGVVRSFVGGGSDPTEIYALTCGHEVI